MSAKAYSGKTILISGGRGFIGSALAQSFVDVECRVILLDHLPNRFWLPQGKRAQYSSKLGDISLPETWKDVLPGVDYFFHFAALEYHRTSYDMFRDLQMNAISCLHCLECCRINEFRPKIVFASSANLFGGGASLPVSESARDNPPSLWSLHKLLAEHYFRVYAQTDGIDSVSLRLSNVYGPTANPDVMKRSVVNRMIANALSGEPLVLFSNRNRIRDFVYLDDVVQAFLLAGRMNSLSDDNRFYVIGSEERATYAEVGKLIANQVSASIEKTVVVEQDDSVSLEPLDSRDFVADSGLFCGQTGWVSRVSINDGIGLTINAMKQGGISK